MDFTPGFYFLSATVSVVHFAFPLLSSLIPLSELCDVFRGVTDVHG